MGSKPEIRTVKYTLPNSQILEIHTFENSHPKSQIKCQGYLGETRERNVRNIYMNMMQKLFPKAKKEGKQ